MKKGKLVTDNNILVSLEITSSLIGKFFKRNEPIEYCPKEAYETYITGNYSKESTKAMKRGTYFETILLGANVRGEPVEKELTEVKKTPTAEQKRIDIQIERAKKIIDEKEMIISSNTVQVNAVRQMIFPDVDFSVFLSQTADLITPIVYKDVFYDKVNVDLKLTGSLSNTWGDFGWANWREMDKTQALLASYVHKLPFFYFIFDYPASGMTYKLIKVNTSSDNRKFDEGDPMKNEMILRDRELRESVRNTALLVEKHFYHGWEAWPSTALCQECPLNAICEESFKYEESY